MQYRILGPLEISADDGQRITVSAPLVRAAICVLALHAGQPLTAEQLIDLLWDYSDGEDKTRPLITCMSQVRKALAPWRTDPLITEGRGYQLRIAPGRDFIDVEGFRQGIERGLQALSRGDSVAATRRLGETLGLWRSPALADIRRTTAIAGVLEELEEQRRLAEDTLLHTRLSLGEHEVLVPHLRIRVAREPLNERLRAMLMVALYRSGRTQDALRSYSDAETVLARELGIRPGHELRRLLTQIRGNDDADLTLPALKVTTIGHIGRAETQSREPSGILRQLPPDIDVSGRATEIAGLVDLLTASTPGRILPVAQIIGPPGVGKTSLAVRVAHQVRDHYPDGQLFIRLGGGAQPRDVATVVAELLRELDIPADAIPGTLDARTALYRSQLADRRVLVVIDDVASADQVRQLQPGTADCAVIATSRTQLTGPAGAHVVTLEPLAHSEAIEMLSKIIGKTRVGAQPRAASKVVESCGRLPIAIQIAGARLSVRPKWPLSHFADLLAVSGRQRLKELTTADLAVQRSFALSYYGLSRQAQRAYALTSLAGPHPIAGWVVDLLTGDPSGDIVETLVTNSLLTAAGVDATGQPRYQLHQLLRDYGSAQLADTEIEPARDRLIIGWFELTALASAQLPNDPYFPVPATYPDETHYAPDSAKRLVNQDAYAWLEIEHPNIVAAVTTACHGKQLPLAFGLASRLASFLHLQYRHDLAEHMWQTIAQAAAERQPAIAALAQFRAAMLAALDLDDPARSLDMLNRCVPAFEIAHQTDVLARALALRARCTCALQRAEDAQRDAERGLRLARALDDSDAEFGCRLSLGQALGLLGAYDDGLTSCSEALELARRLRKTNYEALALSTLAGIHSHAARYDLVPEPARRARDVFVQLRDHINAARCSEQIADAYRALERHTEAIPALENAVELYTGRRAEQAAALSRYRLADSHAQAGSPARAIALLQQTVGDFERLAMKHERAAAQQRLDTLSQPNNPSDRA